jgi:hypothetical protein
VTVTAGQFDRDRTPVSIALGAEAAGKVLALRDAAGTRLPLQADAEGRAVFVLPALKAGASATFNIDGTLEAPAGVEARKGDDHVEVAVGSAVLFRYQMQGKLPAGVGQNYLRGGYVHPMYTPTGVLVTDDYPGDHRHHHGIWSAWAHTTFAGRSIDFLEHGRRLGQGRLRLADRAPGTARCTAACAPSRCTFRWRAAAADRR